MDILQAQIGLSRADIHIHAVCLAAKPFKKYVSEMFVLVGLEDHILCDKKSNVDICHCSSLPSLPLLFLAPSLPQLSPVIFSDLLTYDFNHNW
ncbi:hypothetical protein Y032_0342g3031 [Ancylostoma ceylanicum]|uniref:Uncharacterized protein n=1 Tax=Ancylostoma ceylanicum TaxID=53326 RepID=A0A016RYR7_9BILA|nr:hypothetical protein Y032_0342g3031 [Ancylostoma ceylanicum]